MNCRVPFNPATSLLAGLPTATLQAQLQEAQLAYLNLAAGGKAESLSYTQGDGAKSVTYTRANLADLAAVIQLLQSQLGVVARARRPLRPVYR